MTTVSIDGAVRLRQRVTTTHAFTGIRTVHGDGVAEPVRTPQTYTYDTLDDDGEGLLEPGILTRFSWASRIFHVKLLVGAETTWQIFATAGDDDGDSEYRDDVTRDVLVAQGAGDYLWNAADLMIPRRGRLRVITSAVTRASYGEIEVYFAPIRNTA